MKPSKLLEAKWFRVVHTYYFNKYSLWNIFTKANLFPYEIVEGDHFHDGEIFLFAKKDSGGHHINISKEHYTIQEKLFKSKLKEQRSIKYRISKLAGKFTRRLKIKF